MHDSEIFLTRIGKQFLIKENFSLDDLHKRVIDEIGLKFIKNSTEDFYERDIISAGTMVNCLISEGYLKTEVIKERGLIITISEKGKEYIKNNKEV